MIALLALLALLVAALVLLLRQPLETYVNSLPQAPQAEGAQLVIKPIVLTMNSIVDAINTVPPVLYAKSSKMSKAISMKIREYAEHMKSFNRSPDDCTNLQTVTVNSRHKLYIDAMSPAKRAALAKLASEFYGVPFGEQEEEIKKILLTLAKQDKRVADALAASSAEE